MLRDPQATIAAIATPPGEGGVAIVRISGEDALDIASKVFSKRVSDLPTHTASYGKFFDEHGDAIDKGLAIAMHAPKTFTGEPVVEFHCHGSSLIARHLLNAVLKAGARMAEPGEFTRRAFLNGKLDLVQAEAVQALIAAKSDLAMKAAEKHLEGRLSEKIGAFQKKLTDIAAILEAWVDFPEEGLEFATHEELLGQLESLLNAMNQLRSTFHQGKMMREGYSLCLAGLPNAGKSSLMNALLDFERAIVTPIAGTTRDTLQEDFRLGGLHFHLIDTAGLRKTNEPIEQEGIRRTKAAMQEADLILYVVDAAEGLREEDEAILSGFSKEKTLLVWNKCDLPCAENPRQEGYAQAEVSALRKEGLETLGQAIQMLLWKEGLPDKEEVILTHARHYDALQKAIDALTLVIQGLQTNISPEFLTSDIRASLHELSTLIGRDVTEEILNAIFAKFCVGK